MANVLRVGIVGASAERGWAKESHIPAVQKLAGFELAAVAAGDKAKSEAAAHAFGARRAYANAKELVRDPDIDLVTVAVKVPDHRELLMAALATGKNIYCEWPLGRNLTEAEELAAAAERAGVRTAIGLQTRQNRAALQARQFIASGAVGRPLSARLYSGTIAFSRKIATSDLYLEDADNGATLVSIHGGHAIDFAFAMLGPLQDLNALGTTQYPEIEVGDNDTRHARSIPDHVLVQARMKNGAALSVEVAGGRAPKATPFRLEVTGEKGDLVLDGGAPRGFQSGTLRLTLNGEPQHVDLGEATGLPDTAVNVALVYAALRDDIRDGTSTVPGFRHAVQLTQLCDDLVSSSQTGTRKSARDWPEK